MSPHRMFVLLEINDKYNIRRDPALKRKKTAKTDDNLVIDCSQPWSEKAVHHDLSSLELWKLDDNPEISLMQFGASLAVATGHFPSI